MASNHSGSGGENSEAAEYVEAIMSSQQAIRVTTPVQSGRKRNASEPCNTDTTVKKARVTTQAKRNLYQSVPSDDSGKHQSVEHLIAKLNADMHMQFSAMNERMDKLESSLEQRISNKVAQIIDKRVNTELSRIRKDVDCRLESFKEEIKSDISADLHDINDKMRVLSNGGPVNSGQTDVSLNIVIRGLPESSSENTSAKVNTLIRDGLKVSDVTCISVERKKSSSSKPGIVIAKFKSHDDKRKVMVKKSSLGDSRQYRDVFIHHDQSHIDRIMANNFRTILSAMKQHDFTMRGSRIVRVNGDRPREDINQMSSDREHVSSSGRDRGANYGGNRGGNRGGDRDGWNRADSRGRHYNRRNGGGRRGGYRDGRN